MVVKDAPSSSRAVHFRFRRSASLTTNEDADAPSTSGQREQPMAKSFTYGSYIPVPEGQKLISPDDSLLALLQLSDHSPSGTSPKLIKLIVDALERNVERNDLQERMTSSTVGSQHMLPTGKLTVFHGIRPPPISLQAYLERLAKYTKCSPVCFVISLYYMDQLAQRDPGMLPAPMNIHRLLLAGILVAAKLMDDHYFNNAFYGRVGGVSIQEVNRLEIELLKLLDFRIWVPWEDIRAVLKRLVGGKLVIGQGEGDRSSFGLKRRSVSGNSTEKRSQRRSSMDSSVAAPSTSVSVSAYDAADDDDDDY